jgi:predicted O-methyltransferase YrrM
MFWVTLTCDEGEAMSHSDVLRTAWIACRNIGIGANLQSLRLLAQPRRMVTYASESLFLYRAMHGRGLPEQSVTTLAGGTPLNITLCEALRDWNANGSSYALDLVNLAMLCRVVNPKTIFEIGTASGQSAHVLALNSPAAQVFTLDVHAAIKPTLKTTMMDDHHRMERKAFCFDNSPEASRITPLLGDSAVFDYRPYHGTVDLFFIDGAHSYEYVKSDTERALQCCHSQSVIAWHDFGRAGVNGVSRYLLEMRRAGHPIYATPFGSLAYMIVP